MIYGCHVIKATIWEKLMLKIHTYQIYEFSNLIKMSKLATVYDNYCLSCGEHNPAFSYQPYCNQGCESNHQAKLERKEEKDEKWNLLLSKIKKMEDRISFLESKLFPDNN